MRKTTVVLLSLLAPLPVSAATRILVPAYFDPGSGSGWNTIISSISSQVPITAIMNPNSGPVATVNPSYTSAISAVNTAGGNVVAYVHTTYGQRSLSLVEQDVATYFSQYPNISGIFVDEMDNTAANLSYYQSLYSYIKSEKASWQVIGNPGTDTIASYLSPTPAADELMTFESNTGYSTYSPPSWESGYSSSKFANVVYNVSNATAMEQDLSRSVTDHAGNVYFTNRNGVNPYSQLPSYWTSEVAAVSALNGPTPKGTYIASTSGDYNVAGNWSGGIPNAINAEADFLSAITTNHTVYSDSAITLGRILFNNSHTYVLAGAGSVTLNSTTSSARVDVQAGVQKITLPISIASNTVFNASTGSSLVIDAPVTVNTGQTLTTSGTVNFLSTLTLQSGSSTALSAGVSIQSLSVATASQATLIAPATGRAVLQLGELQVSAGASLDLNQQDLVVHGGDADSVAAAIQSGTISGGGVSAVGMIPNTLAGQPIIARFDGLPVTISDLLLRTTLFGDTHLKGSVDSTDYTQINAGFADGGAGWFNGDFNYDGIINGSDYSLIDNAFIPTGAVGSGAIQAAATAQISPGISAVPEPVGGAMVVAVLTGLTRRRRLCQSR